MTVKMTRRRLAHVALAGAAALPAAEAQTAVRNPVDQLAAARRSLETAAQELNAFKIPPATEPAFLFRA